MPTVHSEPIVNSSRKPSSHSAMRAPEVLAPVGSADCLPAAVAGGADAVYLGLRHFNARGRAENFKLAALPDQIAYLHHHGLKCYIVLNTLLHDDELQKALRMAAQACAAGVDAAIIQDLGLWRLLSQELPELPRHASTQMTVHDPRQIETLAELGAERVILARELSAAEVAECTRVGQDLGVETEHFVHGALCYAFSGQCLISNFAGCRSANRGTCAQNCRFEYSAENEAAETLLSMKDLNLLSRVGEMADAGVASLKIEGRLKGPDYVYTVSAAYRAAVNAWIQGEQVTASGWRDRLRDVFARPFTDSPWAGAYDAAARVQRYQPQRDAKPDAQLERLDRAAGEAVIRAVQAPQAGQGFRFAVGFATDGFLVTAVKESADGSAGGRAQRRWLCRVRTQRHGPAIRRLTPIFRNADHDLRRSAQRAMAEVPVQDVRARIRLNLTVTGSLGQVLQLSGTTADGLRATVSSPQQLTAAERRPLDSASAQRSLGALGETDYQLAEWDWHLADGLFLPLSTLKQLRRDMVSALDAARAEQPQVGLAERVQSWEPPTKAKPAARTTQLWVAVSSVAAARAAHAAGAALIWADDVEMWSGSLSSPAAHNSLAEVAAEWHSAVDQDAGGEPRVWLRQPATAPSLNADQLRWWGGGVIAGQLGALRAAAKAGLPCIADAGLNVLNCSTADQLGELGAQAVVMSLEVSCREIARMAARRHDQRQPQLAITVHGRLPAMVTRQDHGLAVGEDQLITASSKEGGLPYRLQRRHDGTTVLWEGRTLCAPQTLAGTQGVVDAWVLELGDLPAEGVGTVVQAYTDLLAGSADAESVAGICAPWMPQGAFPGHLHQGSRELDRVEQL